jgi:hypothetical protein
MEVVARKSVLGTLPTLARIAAFEKSPGGGYEIEVFPSWRTADVVDIKVIDAAADILPAFTAIQATDDAAVFQADVENLRIIRMNEDMAHMLSVRRPRIAPFRFHLRRQILYAVNSSHFSPPFSLR